LKENLMRSLILFLKRFVRKGVNNKITRNRGKLSAAFREIEDA